jgi:peptidoglycan/LPS O-acetylase OafA/YrhL
MQLDESVVHRSYAGLQLLRFVAALMVVITHATFYVSTRIDDELEIWSAGTQGVPIFFVISGFVMALTSRPLMNLDAGAKRFVLSRIIRIVPLYWGLNFLKIGLIVFAPTLMFVSPDILNIISSMLFLFSRNADGAIETFYGVGWTLNFEMFFYSIFAVAIALNLKTIWFVGSVLIVTSLLSLLREDSWPSATYVFSPIVLNFLWGVLIERVIFEKQVVSVWVSSLMVGVGLIVIFGFPHSSLIGLQYALLVGGIVFLENCIAPRIPRAFIFGGDASYSLYLIHPMVGVFSAILLSKLGVTSLGLAMIAIIGTCLVFATMVYRYFEFPTTRYLKAHILARPVPLIMKRAVKN